MRKLSFTLALLLGLSVASHTGLAQGVASAKTLVKEGIALYDQGNYQEAIRRYEQAIKLEPGNYTARYELAMTYNTLGQHKESAALCKELLKDDPEPSAAVYGTYGNALDGLKKPKDAVKIYQEGLKRYPDDGSLYFNLGVTQASSLEQPAEAMASMQQAVRCRPEHTNSLNAVSLLTLQLDNRVPALLEMLRLLQLEPTGKRAEATIARFDNALGLGVKKTGDKAVTINLSSNVVGNVSKENIPDNFAGPDMLLTMSGALDHSKENSKKTAPVLFADKLALLVSVLEENHPEKQTGFAWQYFVPYFVEMKKQGHLPALAYSVQASRAEATPEIREWLAAHAAEVQALNKWSAAYIWPK
ncbi:tetratricopeptide repeat protein [Hymenobacter lutimineralis]|uniref:Tetratricopeptide repeat protein n=1 Tax=Hymenobacter lutimineralis TaxID=2606448 RepID=A0A5D6V524_9BACT|nr:tetratricopeptide repeat protein [Hymenobacter lutimineralis]TYZ10933.1 tetratricopeptide repeat protein [Hymenobacter lutimineralis]